MSVNLNYWIRPSQKTSNGNVPVYLNINYNGVKCQYSIGVETKSALWDKKAQRIKGKSDEANAGNAKLVAVRTRAMNIFNELLISGEPFNAHTIKNRLVHGMVRDKTLQETFDEQMVFMKKLKGKEYSQPTINKYENTLDRVNEFIQFHYKREELYLYELDYNFINNFSAWLKSKYDNSNNTVYKHYQRLSKVIHVAINKGYLNRFPFGGFTIRQDKPCLIYLTVEEIKRIEKKEFNSLRLEQVKKIFLLSCYCGLSFKELENLKKENIFKGQDGIYWLSMIRQKTKKQFRVVLLPQAYNLIEELQGCKPANKNKSASFLPMLSNQKYNSYLKEIADQCGIGKALSSHVGRKSFCNLALRLGLPIDMVSKLLGHNSISVTMAHYNAISEERMVDDVMKLNKRLENL